MRGDVVPPSTRWQGNPIASWNPPRKKRDSSSPKRSRRPRERRKRVAKKNGSPVIDPYLPGSGNFGYRVSRYELELEYKVAINRLAGAATITAVTLAELATFTLDLSDALAVSKVTVNGRRPSQFRTQAGKLHVTLAERLPAGAAMVVAVRYGGTPRPIRSHWGEVGFEELTEGVLVAGQPNGAASWFPCDDHPSAKASFRVQISTESPYFALNGKLLSRRARAGMTTWVYEAGPPSTYLVTLQIGVYSRQRMSKNGVEIFGPARPATHELRNRLRPSVADDEAVREAVRSLSSGRRIHRGGDRRRPRDPPRGAGNLHLRRQPL
ncbi:hypothetical protein MHIP_59730 [Mycolicibacterium hippocampi]|uniref:Aminopeptidase N-like N-terminal domain-containing protein n=1 Tax=Mycolicibacterium hippocampi TaxID=659824 RepID=A0A7I9ZWR3_9MYCO|nr:hypothetical protein MHIP_59730 [Mycolicibacterium hippocampi]